jgi:hypothetical protein
VVFQRLTPKVIEEYKIGYAMFCRIQLAYPKSKKQIKNVENAYVLSADTQAKI